MPTVLWVNIGIMENQMEKKMENEMETSYIGVYPCTCDPNYLQFYGVYLLIKG